MACFTGLQQPEPLAITASISAIFGAILLLLYLSDRRSVALLHFSIWNFISSISLGIQAACVFHGYIGLACYWQPFANVVTILVAVLLSIMSRRYFKDSARWITVSLITGIVALTCSCLFAGYLSNVLGNLLLSVGTFLISLSMLCAYYDGANATYKTAIDIVAESW